MGYMHLHSEMGASGLTDLTGLSACIFFACGKKGYRCNPLRGPNGEAIRPGEFALCANSENQNAQRFGSPCAFSGRRLG
jgi:hypothetical protein